MSLIWPEVVRDEAYYIYNTLDLCFLDTNTKNIKTTTTMTTDNVNCDHDTVREGLKSWMESVRSTVASTSTSSFLAYQYFIVKISVHALLLRRLLHSSCNGEKTITATLIPIFYLVHVSQSFMYFQKRCLSKHNSTGPILRNTVVFGSSDGIEGLLSPKSTLHD